VTRKVIRKGVGNATKNGKALLAKKHEICGEEIGGHYRCSVL